MRPAWCRYSVTPFGPGARLVFTHGCDWRPRSTAFLATSPAAIMTDGFEVLVQLVIAAMTTEPCRSLQSTPSSFRSTCVRRGGAATAVPPPNGWPPSASQWLRTSLGGAMGEVGLTRLGRASRNARPTARSGTRSCGRRGPARLGSTVARSSDSVSEYTGSGASGVWNRPCAFMYAATSATCSGVRPLNSRSEEHTSELQSQSNLVCRLLL